MSQHQPPQPDGAFERLRAADPAAGHAPDAATLDAAVRQRLTDPGDELARARATRRPGRWAAVAAVAAGTLVVGSVGGYALGQRAGESGIPQAAAPAITLDGGAGAPGQGATEQDAARSAAGATEAQSGAADTAVASSMPWFGGRTVFTAQGLSDEGGSAPAWAYDPAGVFSAETAAKVAQGLGLTGEPRLEGGTWVVGPQDGTGPSLQLQPDGTASVSYYDPTRDPFGCKEPVGIAEGEGGGSEPSPEGDLLFPPCEPDQPEPEPALGADDAVARAREVMTAAGVDATAYRYEVGETGNPGSVYVTAFEVVDGQQTGLSWSLTFVGAEVQALYGGLAPRVALGTYDVVSPAEAVSRLTDPRFGMTVGGPIMAVAEDAAVAEEKALTEGSSAEPAPGPAGVPTPPAAVEAGQAISWPVREVALTGARLGLALHTEPGGATVLVPAYELSDDDGSVWSVVAVAESGLDFSTP